jgi:uracil-DNA glycosylase
MSSKKAFAELAANRWNGKPYIHAKGEPHYRFHLRVVEGVYDTDLPFETFAAATELFFCASTKSNQLPYPGSACADQFLPITLNLIQPKVILAVGSRVLRFFNGKKDAITLSQLSGREYPIVWMPHPADPELSETVKEILLQKTILTVRKHLGKGG